MSTSTDLLRQALAALEGWLDQPETPEAYDASMERGWSAILEIRGYLALQPNHESLSNSNPGCTGGGG